MILEKLGIYFVYHDIYIYNQIGITFETFVKRYIKDIYRGLGNMPKRIIQPGDIYKIDGVAHQVITATSEIIGEHKDALTMSELVFWIDNLETNERVYLTENELRRKIEYRK